MTKEKKEGKFEGVLKDIIILVVTLVWIAALICSYLNKFDIPNSVEVGFTMVLGYLLGDKVIKTIREK